jgi:phosphate-selective porin OprO/OprP
MKKVGCCGCHTGRWLVMAIALSMACLMPAATGLADQAVNSGFDKAWSYLTLYENGVNPVVQRFALSGRAQVDAVWIDPEEGRSYDDTAWRRFRFGFKADLLADWMVHLEADYDLNGPVDESYTRLTDAYVAWSPDNSLEIKALKQEVGFTLDGATSSKRLLTLERNNLTNNLWFTEAYFSGVMAKGNFARDWRYQVGCFSSDGDPEIKWGSAGWFTLWTLGWQLENAELGLTYVYQDEDKDASTNDFRQVASLTVQWQKGALGIWSDFSGGWAFSDHPQSDVWGLVVMPFYDVTRHIQLVLRYTHVDSREDNGLFLNRYENEVVEGRGDRYDEGYVGINVYVYGHRLKWQTGVLWADMADDPQDGGAYEGWTLMSGIRVYW